MENHAIPQDITGFQFKLIGEMTVKQFAYLAIGVTSGWFIIWILGFIPLLIRFPIGLLIGGIGAAFAFLPFEGRPLDTMIMHFFYSFTKPTRFVFKKEETQLDELYKITLHPQTKQQVAARQERTHSQEDLQAFLRSIPKTPKNTLDEKEMHHMQTVTAFAIGAPVPPSLKATTLAPTLKPGLAAATINVPQAPTTPKPVVELATTPKTSQPTTSKTELPQAPFPVAPITMKPEPPQATVVQSPSPVAAPQTPVPLPTPEPTVTSTPITMPQPVSDQPVSPEKNGETVEQTSVQEPKLKQELAPAKPEETAQKDTIQTPEVHPKVQELSDQLNQTAKQKQQLEQELQRLQQQLEEHKAQQVPQTQTLKTDTVQTTSVRMIPKAQVKAAGAPLVPEAANLITGIVKDPRGNPLSNILIEVKDKDGNPIRAFKTNALGQFAAATAVVNGTYTIEFEDPAGKQKFEPAEILASGEVIMPLEATSTDEREELRRSLFGNQMPVMQQ